MTRPMTVTLLIRCVPRPMRTLRTDHAERADPDVIVQLGTRIDDRAWFDVDGHGRSESGVQGQESGCSMLTERSSPSSIRPSGGGL